jgi:putative transposase
LGRDEPKRRRAHLYAVIQEMIAEPQGVCEKAADIQRLCALDGVSRAGYYRHLAPRAARRDDADLRDLIQRIALENRAYGYRRIAHGLRRQGLVVNLKRVLRLTREGNLLALRRRPFVPQTTISRHGFEIAPNRTRNLKPTGLDQIWVADITYVRLAEDFVYLAVVLDAFSRKVVGWALAGHLEASLAIEALNMASSVRDPTPDSLIHHSVAASNTLRSPISPA